MEKPKRTTIKQRYEAARNAAIAVQADVDTVREDLERRMGGDWMRDLDTMTNYLIGEGVRTK